LIKAVQSFEKKGPKWTGFLAPIVAGSSYVLLMSETINVMSNSGYETKLEKAMWELHEKGVRRKQSHTLLFKLLRLLGFEVRLPHYSKPKSVLIYSSLYFTVLVGVFLFYVQYKSNEVHVVPVIVMSVVVGTLFGGVMMLLTTYNQKKHELTLWEDL